MTVNQKKRVVIVGGGFGGLHAAMTLRKSDVNVTLVDRRNFHLFQPLLYQVATGGLSPANIATPLRSILRRQKNVFVTLGEVIGVDPTGHSIQVKVLEPGESAPHITNLEYDWLIVAAGSIPSFFGHHEWEQLAPGLKTIEEATEIRARIFSAFEAAEQETDPLRRNELMTFVIVGGGPTGVEMAGAIAELARKTLRNDFRNINPPDARIIIVDGQDRVLGSFPPKLSGKAQQSLVRLGVEFRANTMVNEIRKTSVEVTTNGQPDVIATCTVLWAAGVSGAPLGKTLAESTQCTLDRAGRVPVENDLSIKGHSNIFVIGDLASFHDEDPNKQLPGVAPVAIQQGRFVGKLIAAATKGKKPETVFHYHDKGNLATIGRRSAVADLGRFKFSGFFAWLIWIFVHIMSIVQFQNRVLVFFQWAWNYITFNRSARLITESAQAKKPTSTTQDETSSSS